MLTVPQILPGSTIGVVASGSPLDSERLRAGTEVLKSFGYQLKMPLSPDTYFGSYEYGFTNGSPEMRKAAFVELLEDDSVRAIITARGGYGSLDILPLLPYELLRSKPKLIVGMSDATVLLTQTVARASVPSIHGPGIGTSFADYHSDPQAKQSVDALLEIFQNPNYLPTYNGDALRRGVGEGALAVGNLTMLCSLLGTPWDFGYEGKILLLEEVGSKPFQVHRSLLQLKLAGKFDRLAALGFGRFSRCEAAHGPGVQEVLDTFVEGELGDTRYPVIGELPFGHWGENAPMVLGIRAQVEDSALRILESHLATC